MLRSMLKEAKELWKYRELLWTMVERELRIRYKNSILGFFWSLINPLVTVLVMTFVFTYLMESKTPSFSAYVLAAYLPYMAFQMSLLDSAQSVLVALPIVKKVYFPREILPLATVISNFIHFALALLVFFLYLLVVYVAHPQVSPFQSTLFWVPALMLVHFCLTAGLSLFVSALNTFYEDVKYVLGISLYLMFFLCPVMYFSEQVRGAKDLPDWAFTVDHLNPVAMLCTSYRKVMLAPIKVHVGERTWESIPLDPVLMGVMVAVAVGVLVGGYAYFNRVKWRFVERP